MSVVECGRGHLYDTNIYTACPYCNNNTQAINFGGIAVDGDNRTRPLSNNFNLGPNSNGSITPVTEVLNSSASVLNEGKTLPPKSYVKAKSIEEDNKTIGLMKEKLGMDPVVGWLVCIAGKEIGKDYKIRGQINTIGRSEKMDICIKDDQTISFDNHARLSYSERNQRFNLLPAESKNVIYLNDNEVFTPTELNSYDVIDFGDTKLMFIAFCSDKFDWKSNNVGDTGNVSV